MINNDRGILHSQMNKMGLILTETAGLNNKLVVRVVLVAIIVRSIRTRLRKRKRKKVSEVENFLVKSEFDLLLSLISS